MGGVRIKKNLSCILLSCTASSCRIDFYFLFLFLFCIFYFLSSIFQDNAQKKLLLTKRFFNCYFTFFIFYFCQEDSQKKLLLTKKLSPNKNGRQTKMVAKQKWSCRIAGCRIDFLILICIYYRPVGGPPHRGGGPCPPLKVPLIYKILPGDDKSGG